MAKGVPTLTLTWLFHCGSCEEGVKPVFLCRRLGLVCAGPGQRACSYLSDPLRDVAGSSMPRLWKFSVAWDGRHRLQNRPSQEGAQIETCYVARPCLMGVATKVLIAKYFIDFATCDMTIPSYSD